MNPKIIIPVDIKNKIQFIVDNCDLEVSGLGTVVYDKTANAYRVMDILLLKQEVGAAHTDIDDDAVAQAIYDMRNSEGELSFWWHSHVNMSTFWSTTDMDTMTKIGKNGLCVAAVFNKKEEVRGAIVMSPENMPSVTLYNVDIEFEFEYAFDTLKLLEEIKEKVKPKAYSTTYTAPKWYKDEHGNWVKEGDEKDKTPTALADAEKVFEDNQRVKAQGIWGSMPKREKKRYSDFNDFFDEYLWGEYSTDTHYSNSQMHM